MAKAIGYYVAVVSDVGLVLAVVAVIALEPIIICVFHTFLCGSCCLLAVAALASAAVAIAESPVEKCCYNF